MSEIIDFKNTRNRHYDHSTFDRLKAMQSQGPETMRRYTKFLWKALSTEEQIDYIHEAVDAVGMGEYSKEQQDSHLNERLLSEYMSPKTDPHNHYHRVDLR